MKNFKYIYSYLINFFIILLIHNIVYRSIGGTILYYIIYIQIFIVLSILAVNYKYFVYIIFIQIILVGNSFWIFASNQDYNYSVSNKIYNEMGYIYKSVPANFCFDNMLEAGLGNYEYHAPKSNLFLPTLGIRYKENYEEERGIVIVYGKHSYFNLYVGDGKVICKSEGNLETLE